MKKVTVFLTVLVCSLLVCATAFAQVTRVDKPIDVQASINGASNFDVKIYRSTTSTTYNWTTDYINVMNFGALVPADVDNPTTSALTASQHFLALCTVTNNTGSTYRVQVTGAPLRHTDATTTLPNNAWTLTAGNQINTDGSIATVYPAGVTTTRRSAGITTAQQVYASNTSGLSDTFRVYFAITGDPTKAVSSTGVLIPPTQKAGTYSAQVILTLLP
jgi:hypothetical protein